MAVIIHFIHVPFQRRLTCYVVQGALQWLEDNENKTVEEILAEAKPSSTEDAETDPSIEPAPLKEGEVAKSMVCNVCNRKFRSMAQVEFHASKTYRPSLSLIRKAC